MCGFRFIPGNRWMPGIEPYTLQISVELEETMASCKRFMADESGASAVEYGLIVALVVVGMLTGVRSLGPSLSEMFQRVSTILAG